MVIAVLEIKDIIAGADCAALGIFGSKVYFADAGLDYGSRTHGAGFQCDIQIAIYESPGVKLFTGFSDRQDFGMSDGILLADPEIMSAGDDLAVFDYDGTYRAFLYIICLVGFFHGLEHKKFMFVFGPGLEYLVFALHGNHYSTEHLPCRKLLCL